MAALLMVRETKQCMIFNIHKPISPPKSKLLPSVCQLISSSFVFKIILHAFLLHSKSTILVFFPLREESEPFCLSEIGDMITFFLHTTTTTRTRITTSFNQMEDGDPGSSGS